MGSYRCRKGQSRCRCGNTRMLNLSILGLLGKASILLPPQSSQPPKQVWLLCCSQKSKLGLLSCSSYCCQADSYHQHKSPYYPSSCFLVLLCRSFTSLSSPQCLVSGPTFAISVPQTGSSNPVTYKILTPQLLPLHKARKN